MSALFLLFCVKYTFLQGLNTNFVLKGFNIADNLMKCDLKWRHIWPPSDKGNTCYCYPDSALPLSRFCTVNMSAFTNRRYYQVQGSKIDYAFNRHPSYVPGSDDSSQLFAAINVLKVKVSGVITRRYQFIIFGCCIYRVPKGPDAKRPIYTKERFGVKISHFFRFY